MDALEWVHWRVTMDDQGLPWHLSEEAERWACLTIQRGNPRVNVNAAKHHIRRSSQKGLSNTGTITSCEILHPWAGLSQSDLTWKLKQTMKPAMWKQPPHESHSGIVTWNTT